MVKIIETLIPAYSNSRPCTKRRKFSGVTIHETGNYKQGAGAYNHSQYKTVNSGWNAEESYHYVVDSKEAYRLVPESEITWHAGDGGNGSGNNETVSIEICVNPDSDFNVAFNNAAELTADILKRNGITNASDWVSQHNRWSGKNCPQDIRRTGRWNEFISKVQSCINGVTVSQPGGGTSDIIYRVRKSWTESASQLGAYKNLESAKQLADKNPGYEVYDPNGNQVYPAISSSTKTYVNLFAVRDTWAVYPLGVARTQANVKGYLKPKYYGGLSYTSLESLGGSAFVINTSAFGKVQIYCPNDNEGNTATVNRFELCDAGHTAPPAPPAPTGDVEVSRTNKRGSAYIKETIRFRDKPSTDTGVIQGSYYPNESVNYDLVVESTKYTWISWTNASGIRRYMPVVDKANGERWSSY